MAKGNGFRFRTDADDEVLVLLLEEYLEKDSISDVLRYSLHYTAHGLGLLPAKELKSVALESTAIPTNNSALV